jgi:integrase
VVVSLAVVRSLGSARSVRSAQELEDLEQELVDQYALASLGAGSSDGAVGQERAVVFEFVRFLGRPLWTADAADADRYLTWVRRERGNAKSTAQGKAWMLSRFYDFLIARYQGDVHAMTGCVLSQPIDEFNRPANVDSSGATRVPPSGEEVEGLFAAWGPAVEQARKFLPTARNYVTASLWRRVGLRISETSMLDIRDWRPDLGDHGKLHLRFGKGSRGRGPKPRLVPAINSVDSLIEWWLIEVRPQFGDDYADPDAPMFPSERHDSLTGFCTRVGPKALREGLADAVGCWLPDWRGRLTPHGLRHFCASSLYEGGLDIKAIQDLLGHTFLSTTTRYIHVDDEHIDRAWAAANQRVMARFDDKED